MTTAPPAARLEQSLDEITCLLEKHRVLATLTHRQEGPKRDLLEHLPRRQNLAELHRRINAMHAADATRPGSRGARTSSRGRSTRRETGGPGSGSTW